MLLTASFVIPSLIQLYASLADHTIKTFETDRESVRDMILRTLLPEK